MKNTTFATGHSGTEKTVVWHAENVQKGWGEAYGFAIQPEWRHVDGLRHPREGSADLQRSLA